VKTSPSPRNYRDTDTLVANNVIKEARKKKKKKKKFFLIN